MSKKGTTKKSGGGGILKGTSLSSIIDSTNELLHPDKPKIEEVVEVPGKLPAEFQQSLKNKALSETVGIPLEAVIENHLTESTLPLPPHPEEEPKKRGRPPKNSTSATTPPVSPRRSSAVPPSPHSHLPKNVKTEEELYLLSKKIDNIHSICEVIREDPILSKRYLPSVPSRSGLLEDCTAKQLADYRIKLFEVIGRDTQSKIISTFYYGSIGFSEYLAKILVGTGIFTDPFVSRIASMEPGTLSIAIKRYNDSEEGNGSIDRDIRLTAAYYSDIIPSHPILNLVSNTYTALAAIANKPALYGLVFGGGQHVSVSGSGPPPQVIDAGSFASNFGKRRKGT